MAMTTDAAANYPNYPIENADAPACEGCGWHTRDLHEVPDNDPAVGYYGVALICTGCITGTVYLPAERTESEDAALWNAYAPDDTDCPF